MKFPDEWWMVVEVLFAIASLGDEERKAHTEALKQWRKSQIGRGHALKAKEFDFAASGVHKAMAGKPETMDSTLARARWYVRNGIPPAFARPAGHTWLPGELEIIRIARAHDLDPVCYEFTTTGIDQVAGPATGLNPWDKWRRI